MLTVCFAPINPGVVRNVWEIPEGCKPSVVRNVQRCNSWWAGSLQISKPLKLESTGDTRLSEPMPRLALFNRPSREQRAVRVFLDASLQEE